MIVIVEGLDDGGIAWAASQPWIDVVSNSVSNPMGPVAAGSCWDRQHQRHKVSTARGQSVLFSAGNGMYSVTSRDRDPVPPRAPDPVQAEAPAPGR